jgi:hypothetical protein
MISTELYVGLIAVWLGAAAVGLALRHRLLAFAGASALLMLGSIGLGGVGNVTETVTSTTTYDSIGNISSTDNTTVVARSIVAREVSQPMSLLLIVVGLGLFLIEALAMVVRR